MSQSFIVIQNGTGVGFLDPPKAAGSNETPSSLVARLFAGPTGVVRSVIRAILSAILIAVFSSTAHATCPAYTLTNGTPADATQVMANFNCILTSPSFAGNANFASTVSIGTPTTNTSKALYVTGDIYATGSITCGGSCSSGGGGGSSQWTTSGSNISYTAGNVGIGTTSPGYALDIVGNAQFTNSGQLLVGGDGNGGLIRGITPGNLTIRAYSYPILTMSNTGGVNIGTSIFFNTNPAGLNVAGFVGIGTTSPSYVLHVNGTAYATGAAGALSDIRDKKDVAALSISALDTIAKLRPVTFFWKVPKDDGMRGKQTGLIAQEVEKVLPSTILTAKDVRRSKAIKYDELTAVLIKAVQEQQQEIHSQAEEIRKLRLTNAKIEARLKRIEQIRLARQN